jgi:hypothetical protein
MNSIADFHQVAVLIHGCHLLAEEWETIVFGTEEGLGRVPIGIEEAVYKKASLIFWGSGASQDTSGLKESEYTFNQAMGPKLKMLAYHVKKKPKELKDYLSRVSFIDRDSRNTAEEIKAAVRECTLRGIQMIVIVSSNTHVARCYQEACKLKESTITVYARASATCVAHSSADEVTIFEPPHRGDMPKVPIHQTVKGIIPFLKDEKIAVVFNEALKSLIEEYKRKQEMIACSVSSGVRALSAEGFSLDDSPKNVPSLNDKENP